MKYIEYHFRIGFFLLRGIVEIFEVIFLFSIFYVPK